MKNSKGSQTHQSKEHLEATASKLLKDGKKRAHELYEEGVYKKNEIEDQLKEYTDNLLKKVQENPLSAVLIAGGVGFLLSKIMKK